MQRICLLPGGLTDMERCIFCGSELPRPAQFCGYCGRPVNITMRETPTSRSSYPGVDVLVGKGPTAISGTSYPVLRSGEQENITSGHMGSQGGRTKHIPDIPVSGIDEQEDEERERRRRALLGLPLLGALADAPSVGGVPMVQGMPQVGGV